MPKRLLFVGLTLILTACIFDGRSDVEKYCDLHVECYPEEGPVDQCLLDNEYTDTDAICVEEVDALMACLGKLNTCDELEDYFEEPDENYPCAAEDDALAECFMEHF